jgi:hypothetical protein
MTGGRAHPIPILGNLILQPAVEIHGGTDTPTWRTSDANEASVLLSPTVSALYGSEKPTVVSWAVGRKAVAEGDAEPIDGRGGISGMVIVKARYAILAVLLYSCCVAVSVKVVFERALEERQREAQLPGFLIWCLGACLRWHVNKLALKWSPAPDSISTNSLELQPVHDLQDVSWSSELHPYA